MTLLQKKIEQKGLKQTWISEQLNISTRTLQSWLEYENTSQAEKFLKLIEMLGISIHEILEDMEKKKEVK